MEINFNENVKNSLFVTSLDPVVFTIIDNDLHILLIKRDKEPYNEKLMLPGGLFNHEYGSFENGIKEILAKKTNCEINYMEQLYTRTGHDIRGLTISISYIALIQKTEKLNEKAMWLNMNDVLNMPQNNFAFDHLEIIKIGYNRLVNKVNYSNLPMYMLENKFTLPDLQKVYENILKVKLDKSSFRKKIIDNNMVIKLNEEKLNGACRPSELYSAASNNLYNFKTNIK